VLHSASKNGVASAEPLERSTRARLASSGGSSDDHPVHTRACHARERSVSGRGGVAAFGSAGREGEEASACLLLLILVLLVALLVREAAVGPRAAAGEVTVASHLALRVAALLANAPRLGAHGLAVVVGAGAEPVLFLRGGRLVKLPRRARLGVALALRRALLPLGQSGRAGRRSVVGLVVGLGLPRLQSLLPVTPWLVVPYSRPDGRACRGQRELRQPRDLVFDRERDGALVSSRL